MDPTLFKMYFSEKFDRFLVSKKVGNEDRSKIIKIISEKNDELSKKNDESSEICKSSQQFEICKYKDITCYIKDLEIKKILKERDIYLVDSDLDRLNEEISIRAQSLLNTKALIEFPDRVLTSIFQYTPELLQPLLEMAPKNKNIKITSNIVPTINLCKLPIAKYGESNHEILNNLLSFIKQEGKKLTYLDLTNFNYLIDDKFFNKIIPLCPNIDTLKLKSNRISPLTIGGLIHLKHLSLEGNDMRDIDLKFLSNFISLESLTLRNFKNIDGDFFKYISKDSLPSDQDMNVIARGIVSINLEGCPNILSSKFVGIEFNFLETLNLECNHIDVTIFSQFKNLKNLVIKGKLLSDQDLLNILLKFPKLEILEVCSDEVTGAFLKDLNLNYLKILKLNCKDLKDENLLLNKFTSLNVLEIQANSITGFFIEFLVNKNLYKLRLKSESLTDTNLSFLGKIPTLKVLDIEAKNITGNFINSIKGKLKQLIEIRLFSKTLKEDYTKLLFRKNIFRLLKIIETNQTFNEKRFPTSLISRPEDILFFEILDPFFKKVETNDFFIYTKEFTESVIKYAKKHKKLSVDFINNILNIRIKLRFESSNNDKLIKSIPEIIKVLEGLFFSSLLAFNEFDLAIEYLESHHHIIKYVPAGQLLTGLKMMVDSAPVRIAKLLLNLKPNFEPQEFDNLISHLIEYELSKNSKEIIKQIYLLDLFSAYHKIPSEFAKMVVGSIVNFVKDNEFKDYNKDQLVSWIRVVGNGIRHIVDNNLFEESLGWITFLLESNIEDIIHNQYEFNPNYVVASTISHHLIQLINTNNIDKFNDHYTLILSYMLNDEKGELSQFFNEHLYKKLKSLKEYNSFFSDWLFDNIMILNENDLASNVPFYIEFLIKYKHLEKFPLLDTTVAWNKIPLKDFYKVFPAFFSVSPSNAASKTFLILEKATTLSSFNIYECIQIAMENGIDLNFLNQFFYKLEDLAQSSVVSSISVKIAKILYFQQQKNNATPSDSAHISKIEKEIAFYQEALRELIEIKLFDDSWFYLTNAFERDDIVKNNPIFDFQRINIIQNILTNQYESQSKLNMAKMIADLLIQLINNNKIENFKDYFSGLFSNIELTENSELSRLFYIELCKKLDDIKAYNDSFSFWLLDIIMNMDGDNAESILAYIKYLEKHKRLDAVTQIDSQLFWKNVSPQTFSTMFPTLFSSDLETVVSKTFQMITKEFHSLDLYECIENALTQGVEPLKIDKFLALIDNKTKDNLVDSIPVRIAKILYLQKQRKDISGLNENELQVNDIESKINLNSLFESLEIIPLLKSWDDLIRVFNMNSVKNNECFDLLRIKVLELIVSKESKDAYELAKISNDVLVSFLRKISYNTIDINYKDQIIKYLSHFINRSTAFVKGIDVIGNMLKKASIEKVYNARSDQLGEEIKLMILNKLVEVGQEEDKFVVVKDFMFTRVLYSESAKREKPIEMLYKLLDLKPNKILPITSKEKQQIKEKFKEYLISDEDLAIVYLKCYVLTREERLDVISSLIESESENILLVEKLCNFFDKIN